MRHVEDVDRADLVRDLPHAREVPQAGIGAGSADDDLGLLAHRDRLELVVVDHLGVAPHRVEGGVIELSAEAELVTVSEMAAVREIETENGVARLQHRHVCRGIRL